MAGRNTIQDMKLVTKRDSLLDIRVDIPKPRQYPKQTSQQVTLPDIPRGIPLPFKNTTKGTIKVINWDILLDM